MILRDNSKITYDATDGRVGSVGSVRSQPAKRAELELEGWSAGRGGSVGRLESVEEVGSGRREERRESCKAGGEDHSDEQKGGSEASAETSLSYSAMHYTQ